MVANVSKHRIILILMLAHGVLCIALALGVAWALHDDAQSLACCANDHLHLLIVFACLLVIATAEGWSAVSRMRTPAGATSRRFAGRIIFVACLALVAAAVLGNLSPLFLIVALAATLFAAADLLFFQAAS